VDIVPIKYWFVLASQYGSLGYKSEYFIFRIVLVPVVVTVVDIGSSSPTFELEAGKFRVFSMSNGCNGFINGLPVLFLECRAPEFETATIADGDAGLEELFKDGDTVQDCDRAVISGW
jgi:hypothetical protein